MQLTEVGICYFAALIDGLRLIDEKAAEFGVPVEQVDYDALVHYVRVKGDRLVALHYGLRQNPDAVKLLKDVWPTAEPIIPESTYRKWRMPEAA